MRGGIGEGVMMPTQKRRSSRVATKRTRRAVRSAEAKSTLKRAVEKTLTQVKRTVQKVADATGAVVTTARKRVQREVERRHLRQKIRRTGQALKAVARTSAAKASSELAAVRRA
jgi:hypothetical protein